MSTSYAGVNRRAPYQPLRSSGAAETSMDGHGPSVGDLWTTQPSPWPFRLF